MAIAGRRSIVDTQGGGDADGRLAAHSVEGGDGRGDGGILRIERHHQDAFPQPRQQRLERSAIEDCRSAPPIDGERSSPRSSHSASCQPGRGDGLERASFAPSSRWSRSRLIFAGQVVRMIPLRMNHQIARSTDDAAVEGTPSR